MIEFKVDGLSKSDGMKDHTLYYYYRPGDECRDHYRCINSPLSRRIRLQGTHCDQEQRQEQHHYRHYRRCLYQKVPLEIIALNIDSKRVNHLDSKTICSRNELVVVNSAVEKVTATIVMLKIELASFFDSDIIKTINVCLFAIEEGNEMVDTHPIKSETDISQEFAKIKEDHRMMSPQLSLMLLASLSLMQLKRSYAASMGTASPTSINAIRVTRVRQLKATMISVCENGELSQRH